MKRQLKTVQQVPSDWSYQTLKEILDASSFNERS